MYASPYSEATCAPQAGEWSSPTTAGTATSATSLDIGELLDVTVTAAPAYGDAAAAEYRSYRRPEEGRMTATEAPEATETTHDPEPPQEAGADEPRAESFAAATARHAPRRGPLRRTAAATGDRGADHRCDAGGQARRGALAHRPVAIPRRPAGDLGALLGPAAPCERRARVRDPGDHRPAANRVEFPRQTADLTVDFYDELDPITEADPSFDQLTVVPKAIKGLVRGSWEAFEDSMPDLLQLMEAQLVKIMGLKLDAALLFGRTTDNPKAFDGMDTVAAGTIDWGTATNWDPILRAVGYRRRARPAPVSRRDAPVGAHRAGADQADYGHRPAVERRAQGSIPVFRRGRSPPSSRSRPARAPHTCTRPSRWRSSAGSTPRSSSTARRSSPTTR